MGSHEPETWSNLEESWTPTASIVTAPVYLILSPHDQEHKVDQPLYKRYLQHQTLQPIYSRPATSKSAAIKQVGEALTFAQRNRGEHSRANSSTGALWGRSEPVLLFQLERRVPQCMPPKGRRADTRPRLKSLGSEPRKVHWSGALGGSRSSGSRSPKGP